MEKSKQYLVLVIHEGNKLSHNAQAALRRNLEKYSLKLKVIILCDSSS